MESGFKTAKSRSAVGGILNLFDSLSDNRIYLGDIFLDVTLGNLEQSAFCFLKKIVNIIRFVECLRLYRRRKFNKLAGQIFLSYYSGMKFNMCALEVSSDM